MSEEGSSLNSPGPDSLIKETEPPSLSITRNHSKLETEDFDVSSNKSRNTNFKPLSTWQKWLLKKEVERREQAKKFRAVLKNVNIPRKHVGLPVNEKSVEEKEKVVHDWLKKKDRAWKDGRRLQSLALKERLTKEKEMKDITEKMAKLKFQAWKNKKDEEAKQKKIVKMGIQHAESKAEEHQAFCQNAYSRWLESVKDRERRQLEFRQLIVHGVYNVKSGDRNRKQGRPRKSSSCATKRSILCVTYCSKTFKSD